MNGLQRKCDHFPHIKTVAKNPTFVQIGQLNHWAIRLTLSESLAHDFDVYSTRSKLNSYELTHNLE